MKSLISTLNFVFVCVCASVFVSACTSYTLEVKNVSLYNEGVKILDSHKQKSKVRLEIGQGKVGGSSAIPLAILS